MPWSDGFGCCGLEDPATVCFSWRSWSSTLEVEVWILASQNLDFTCFLRFSFWTRAMLTVKKKLMWFRLWLVWEGLIILGCNRKNFYIFILGLREKPSQFSFWVSFFTGNMIRLFIFLVKLVGFVASLELVLKAAPRLSKSSLSTDLTISNSCLMWPHFPR